MERESVLEKIRGLLSKTVESGCTEHEALAALAKARAMMDAYEVTEADLALIKEQGAMLHTDDAKDFHQIRSRLAMAVSNFTETQVYRDIHKKLVFVGTKPDVELATYLLDALQVFVLGELTDYLASRIIVKYGKRRVINGFVLGATQRISDRLRELVTQSRAKQTSTSHALVVAKTSVIADFLKQNNIHIGGAGKAKVALDRSAYGAGLEAGDRASLSRPLGNTSAKTLVAA